MTIARTIQAQLGSALVMLGAHTLIDHGTALSFKFRGSRKANYVKITLAGDDTYTMDFLKLGRGRNFSIKEVASFSGVYASNVKSVIESTTGLRTSL